MPAKPSGEPGKGVVDPTFRVHGFENLWVVDSGPQHMGISLPVRMTVIRLQDGKIIGHTYEQTTYPEWAFSAYRTGSTPQGDLPHGATIIVDTHDFTARNSARSWTWNSSRLCRQ